MRNQGFHYTQIEPRLHSHVFYPQEKSHISAMTALTEAAYSTSVFYMDAKSYLTLLRMYYALYLF
jgi:hypothetical protein